MNRILIVEDDNTIRRALRKWLELDGFIVLEAEDGLQAKDIVLKSVSGGEGIDLVVLDIMLPVFDGYNVLEHIREHQNKWIPVILLTAKSEEEEKIFGLEHGADDYITKPFSSRELVSRIKANIRSVDNEVVIKENNLPFSINTKDFTISNENDSVTLTKKELLLLNYLLQYKNEYVSKKKILNKIWDKDESSRTVDIHVSKLRKKLMKFDYDNNIKTKHGVGYGVIADGEK
ncbi:MAG: response regulator transcription factor [Mycoplasmatales bacterium]